MSEGTTVLLTPSTSDEADRLADRVAVIDHGTLIAEGTPDQVKDRVGGERLEVLLYDAGDGAEAASVLAVMTDERPSIDDRTVCVTVRERAGAIVRAVRLSEAGIDLEDLSVRRPTLDDVFLTLTGHAAEEPSEEEKQAEQPEDAGARR